jgi:hypothetical protein
MGNREKRLTGNLTIPHIRGTDRERAEYWDTLQIGTTCGRVIRFAWSVHCLARAS